MRRFVLLLITTVFCNSLLSQDDKLQKQANLFKSDIKVGNTQLTVYISLNFDKISSTLSVPSQGLKDYPASSTVFTENLDSVILTFNPLGITLSLKSTKNDGELVKLIGNWNQSGLQLPVEFSKIEELPIKSFSQEPKGPFDYLFEEVTIDNKTDQVKLSGTLTKPKKGKKFPAIILISGSGPQDRNQEILGHKPFLLLADELTKLGFAVLRYDDRGTGSSTGDFKASNTFDFTNDALAAYEYLKDRKDIDKRKIILLGHSEGGLVATIAGAKEKKLGGIVLMSSPSLPGDSIMILQNSYLMLFSGINAETSNNVVSTSRKIYDFLLNTKLDEETLKDSITTMYLEGMGIPKDKREAVKTQVAAMSSDWYRTFLSIDPEEYFAKLNCKVMAYYAEKDVQVPAKENIAMFNKIAKTYKKRNFEVETIIGVNHLFQKCSTCLPQEYGNLEETLNPQYLDSLKKYLSKTYL